MPSHQSNIFPTATVSGSIERRSPEGVTLFDEGEYPAQADVLNMTYIFPHFELFAGFNEVNVHGIQTTLKPQGDFWDLELDETYNYITGRLNTAMQQCYADPESQRRQGRRVIPEIEPNFQRFQNYQNFYSNASFDELTSIIKDMSPEGEETILDDPVLHIKGYSMTNPSYSIQLFHRPYGTDLNITMDETHTQETVQALVGKINEKDPEWRHASTNYHLRKASFTIPTPNMFERVPYFLFEKDISLLEKTGYSWNEK